MADAKEIAALKMKDMGLDNIDSAVKSVIGTALSMGIGIIE